MIRSIFSFLRALLFTRELLDDSFIELRHDVCQNHCDQLRRGWIRYYCKECKCTVNKRRSPLNKLAHPCQECPLGKWTKVWGYGCYENERTKYAE